MGIAEEWIEYLNERKNDIQDFLETEYHVDTFASRMDASALNI